MPSVPAPEPSEPDIAPTLAAERAHLAAARAALARMRERTLALDPASAGASALNTEFLKAALHARAAALADDPATPLFFGRIDTGRTAGATSERFYIGRRHVHDDGGDSVVLDWRADISRAFYRATHLAPMDVVLRRRFGFEGGTLTAYEDEHLGDPSGADAGSHILQTEIERPRVGPMRDIVATIQPEQDEIVRAPVTETICVQGAPGTGKTAVGLHRAAYLLYAHRDRLRRSGVLVVGPNRSFLSYVAAVLPALGEIEARHVTVDELATSLPVKGSDAVDVAMLKGDARMAAVLRNAVWSHLRGPTEPLVLPRGARRWRVPAHEVAELVRELRAREVRYGAARSLLGQRLAHRILVQMENAGDSPDDRVQDAVARSREVRSYVDAVWPTVEPKRLLWQLFSDASALAAASDGLLDPAEQGALLWPKPARTPGGARWSAADAVLADEVLDLLDRVPSVGHVVLDEAQDLSPMQLRAVGRRCTTGSATVLGDVAQGTTPWATPSWEASLEHLGKAGAPVAVLDRGFRVPRTVLEFASRLLPSIAPGLAAATSVRESPGDLDVIAVPSGDLVEATVAATRRALSREGSVGLVAPDRLVGALARALRADALDAQVLGSDDSYARLVVVPATLAKGLEYDSVLVVEPADIVAAEASERVGLRRLYVCLTRAVTALAVIHARPLPDPLA